MGQRAAKTIIHANAKGYKQKQHTHTAHSAQRNYYRMQITVVERQSNAGPSNKCINKFANVTKAHTHNQNVQTCNFLTE